MPPVSRRSRGAKVAIWLGLGDGNITFSDELDFDPSELDIVYRGDSTEDER